MRNLMRNNDGHFRTITATGLVPLLLLTGLPGCVARHMPDWSKVQAVAPETTTEVQLYEDSAPQGSRKIKGRLLSATGESVTLKLKDGQIETFQRKKVRKVLAQREFGKRWPGWLALGISLAFGLNAFKAEADFTPAASTLFGVVIPVAIATPFFFGSKMGGIYEVPPNHRDWFPQGTVSTLLDPSQEPDRPQGGEGGKIIWK